MPLRSLLVVVMFLLQAAAEPENPWKKKAPRAVERTEQNPTVGMLREGLDVTWRADDWQGGLRLAELAQQRHADEPRLLGMSVRALWRAGRIAEAERLAERISADSDDPVALRTLATIQLARGEIEPAQAIAARLETHKPQTAEDLYTVFGARFAANEFEGLPELLRRAERLTDPKNGYPEMYVEEAIAGVAEFLQKAGPEPLNQIARHGTAPMEALAMINLPSCEVMIDGRGPYRMIVDTGGSILLALDQAVADEIGVKSLATASVRGIGGTSESGQALVAELAIGTIRCRRVLTRVFDVRGAIMNAADGIIGTGLFSGGRMRLDFVNAELIVEPSKAAPGPGQEAVLRLVADAKLMTPVTLEGEPALALLDSGADVVALAPTCLRRLFPNEEPREFELGVPVGVGSGTMPTILLSSGVDLEIAGREYRKYSGVGLDVLDTTLGPILGVQSDVLVGMPVFRDMRSITVDFPRCRMWIDWLSRE